MQEVTIKVKVSDPQEEFVGDMSELVQQALAAELDHMGFEYEFIQDEGSE